MPTIDVFLTKDEEHLEFGVAFRLLTSPRRETRSHTAKPATFDIYQIWDEQGDAVTGEDFETIARLVQECYYEDMPLTSMGRDEE